MMQVRCVKVDASTIFRRVQRYLPGLEKRVHWYLGYRSGSWRVDEIRPTLALQTMRSANVNIKGFEIVRMIRRPHCVLCEPKIKREIQFINKVFDIAA